VHGRPDRPKLKSAARLETSKEEFGAVAIEFAANYGTWSVNEADKALIRRFEGALVPNNEGNEVKARITLAGNELRLVGELNAVTGERFDAVYQRAK